MSTQAHRKTRKTTAHTWTKPQAGFLGNRGDASAELVYAAMRISRRNLYTIHNFRCAHRPSCGGLDRIGSENFPGGGVLSYQVRVIR